MGFAPVENRIPADYDFVNTVDCLELNLKLKLEGPQKLCSKGLAPLSHAGQDSCAGELLSVHGVFIG